MSMSNCEGSTLWDVLFPNRTQVSFEAFIITFETYFGGKYPQSFVPRDVSVKTLLFYSIVHDSAVVTKTSFINFVQLFGPVR